MADQGTSETLIGLLRSKLGSKLLDANVERGDVVARLDRVGLFDSLRTLKDDPQLQFNLFSDITVVDWMARESEGTVVDRFEVVYHLVSLPNRYRLRIKVWVPESIAEVDSASSLWSGANFMERETWDMYGVKFKGHPDLRRLLTYDEFVGYPLRKDYPVQHKQPRIAMRSPEVRNTAVDMVRPPLVQINRKRSAAGEEHSPGENPLLSQARAVRHP